MYEIDEFKKLDIKLLDKQRKADFVGFHKQPPKHRRYKIHKIPNTEVRI